MRAGDEDRKVDALDRVARRHGIEPLDIVERDVMNARDLKSLIRDPLCALGAHTLTHIAMAGVDAERLRHEIVASADRVREITGHAPRSFAYPYGDSRAAGAREFAAVRGAGFDIAVTTRPALLTPTSCDRPTAFGRVSLNGHFQKTRYVDALLSGLLFRQPRPEPAQLSVPVRAYG
jgi:peptidoglycan/xylan/chitin deacetylase (PgdA/CDA1 family)